MNYDLAMMALEGLSRAPLVVKSSGEGVEIHGPAAGFKELARLCLLLGSEGVATGESFELKPPIHLKGGSASIVLRKTSGVLSDAPLLPALTTQSGDDRTSGRRWPRSGRMRGCIEQSTKSKLRIRAVRQRILVRVQVRSR